jgi:hypothetical protein
MVKFCGQAIEHCPAEQLAVPSIGTGQVMQSLPQLVADSATQLPEQVA